MQGHAQRPLRCDIEPCGRGGEQFLVGGDDTPHSAVVEFGDVADELVGLSVDRRERGAQDLVPDEHKENPRGFMPSKPENRATCAVCHAPDAEGPRQVPRVSIDDHYPRYKCWDCHYPHHPEAN